MFRSKLIRTAVLLVAAFGLVVVCVNMANAAEAQVQVRNENNYEVNSLKFKRVEYVGQCPGVVTSPGTLKARFTSSSTPTDPTRRVIIKNVTEGIDKHPYPYTNRSYDEGQYSESFDFSIGDKHKTRTFSVLEGQNKFEYEIKDSDTILEKGTFTAVVSVKDVGVFPREVICQDKLTCDNEKDCDGKRERQICYTTNECNCPA